MVIKEFVKNIISMASNQQDVLIGGTPNNLANAPPLSSNSNATPLRSKNQQQNAINNIDNQSSKIKVFNKTREEFYKDLEHFHERRGTPIAYLPKIGGREIDLHALFLEVTERGGFRKVTNRDEWDEVLPTVGLRDKCVNACAIVKQIYRRFLDKYERLTFFGEDPDKMEALEAAEVHESGRSRSSRYPSAHGSYLSSVNAVPMSYNYRQHQVNMERRRTFRLSTDLHKQSNYEKLMLSLISPLPNEQDFAINVCTLMANENKLTLKLTEYPKLLDILLAHAGVYSDYTLRQLFEEIYVTTRKHSLHEFWHSLLHNMPQILNFETDDQKLNAADEVENDIENMLDMSDIFNLKREFGTRDFIGHRVLQILNILRNLSFFDDNAAIYAKNRTLLRFIVMSSNVRWGNIHIQALDIAGNIASEVELYDPSTDALSHTLIKTLCTGIESSDRAVIISSLEILFKLCQKDCNEDYIHKCLNLKLYETICSFLALNDIMLLIFTLETIYALTSMGIRSCQLLLQVRGIIDQLVSLISVEAQSYGSDGCVLMRVVETVPGNMLPLVAQNITNLQNATIVQQQTAAAAATTTTTTAQVQQHRVQPIQQVQASTVVHVQQQQQQQQQTSVITTSDQNQIINDNMIAEEQQQQQVITTTMKKPLQQINAVSTATSTSAAAAAATTTTVATISTVLPATSSNQFTKDDEQYALGWLAETFERVQGIEYRIEQQDMYREYLQHCQKCGKHSIVNQMQFPRLVRTIFGNNVGPAIVRRADGTEYTGIHYVAIKHKIQEKVQVTSVITSVISTASPPALITTQTTTVPAVSTNIVRLKKKSIQEQLEEQTKKQLTTTATLPNVCTTSTTAVSTTATAIMPNISPQQSQQTIQQHQQQQQQATTSLIKSLLANKVNQRQQKQKDVVTQANIISQQQQQQQQPIQSPIKVTSNTISALVNNPLLQNTLVKVGQTTIKPLNPQLSLEKKHLVEPTSSVPPPLAPLSGNNVTIKDSGRSVILSGNEAILPSSIIKRKLDDNIGGGLSHTDTPNIKRLAYDANGSVIAIVSNNNNNSNQNTSNVVAREELTAVTPSRNAANLYAEMAASILEDEDLEDIPTLLTHSQPSSQQATTPTATILAQSAQSSAIMSVSDAQQQQQQSVVLPQKLQTNTVSIPMSRQLLFQTSAQSPLKLNSSPGQPTAMATIKTDQGLQTVPVILQQKSMDSVPPQLVLQQQQTPHTTQYVLATNQQGQTYLVAQQTPNGPQPPPAQPTQTVLVTQTPQQQSTGSKTIIILQQQTLGGSQATKQTHIAAGQKMIMNTATQSQPLLLTQRAANTPVSTASSPIIINPGTGALLQRQIQQQQQNAQQSNTGRISPTLLSQLNHIPATIKLHQPNIITSTACTSMSIGGTTATITRVAKPLSLVHTQPLQLQQHASLIQQHIINSGSTASEKRQVILTGNGRAIEIKETLIPQQQLQPLITPTTIGTQTALLNSQTIITHSPVDAMPATVTTSQQLVSIAPQKSTIATNAVASNTTMQSTSHRAGVISRTPSQAPYGIVKTAAVNSNEPPPLAIAVDKEQNTVKCENVAKNTPASVTNVKCETTKCTNVSTPSTIITTTTTSAATAVTSMSSTNVAVVVDPNWLYICDWRNCPRKKFNSINDLQHHVCTAHCPEHLDPAAEIFCQWGAGSNLCDGIPRKRYSLMTHLIDRHVTIESLRQSIQRRLSSGTSHVQPANQQPVTIIRNMNDVQRANSASPSPSSSTGVTPAMGSSALQAIKRHTADFSNSRELMEENEGPVTKSIRLTAALILRNLVTYTQGAKRALRRYEPHLSNIALSNVESSGTVSHILFELNN